MNILILGAGYVGSVLARSLHRQGHDVTAWTRTEDSAATLRADGLRTVAGDLADGWIWDGFNELWDAAVFCASSSRGGIEAYRHVYGRGLRRALERTGRMGHFIYTSSTSVYSQDDGSEVDEASPAVPRSETSEILVEAEDRVLAAYGTVLRLSGIYGPERTVYLEKYVQGGAALPGDGGRWVNMIHRDDAASAAAHLLGRPEAAGQIYNATDSCPVRLRTLVEWLAARQGCAATAAGAPEDAGRKRGITSKRVSNAKLRRLGWEPLYPSYREGYASLLQACALQNAEGHGIVRPPGQSASAGEI